MIEQTLNTAFWIILALSVIVYLFRRWKARKPERFYGQTMGDPGSKPVQNSTPKLVFEREADAETDLPEHYISPSERVGHLAFMLVWITGWSFGVFFAARSWLSMSLGEEGFIFLSFWLAFAIPGWFFAAWVIFKLLRGDHFEINSDD